MRQLSSSSVSRAANALLKGFVTGPRSNRSRIRHRISLKEESPRENRCKSKFHRGSSYYFMKKRSLRLLDDLNIVFKGRFSTVGTEEDRLQRQHGIFCLTKFGLIFCDYRQH